MKLASNLTFNKVRFDQDTDAHLVLQLTAPMLDTEQLRPKLALIMVIDTSGSMAGQKLEYAKQSALKMVDHLKADDTFGLVTFGSNVQVVVTVGRLGDRKDEIRKAISKLTTNGMTNFAGGMMKAFEMLKSLDLGSDCIHRVIMLTDGQANVGPAKTPATILTLLQSNMEHITCSAFGYGSGSEFSPDFLNDFAKEGKGNYAHIENPDSALKAFGTELGGLISTYATDIRVEVNPLAGHTISKVVSDVDVDEESTGEVFVKIPDLLSEETRNIVVGVKLAKQKGHGPRAVNAFNVKATYQTFDSTGKKHSHTVEANGKVRFVKEGDEDKAPVKTLDDIVGLAQLVRAQLEAEDFAKKGNFDGAKNVMRTASVNFTGRGLDKLAAASSDLSCRMENHTLYAANNGYLRSFEAGATRGLGVASYASGSDQALASLGVQMSNSSTTSTASSFAASSITIPEPAAEVPHVSGYVAPASIPSVWSGIVAPVGGVVSGSAIVDNPLWVVSPDSFGSTVSVHPPVPEKHETSKSDGGTNPPSKSAKKSLKQSRSKSSW